MKVYVDYLEDDDMYSMATQNGDVAALGLENDTFLIMTFLANAKRVGLSGHRGDYEITVRSSRYVEGRPITEEEFRKKSAESCRKRVESHKKRIGKKKK